MPVETEVSHKNTPLNVRISYTRPRDIQEDGVRSASDTRDVSARSWDFSQTGNGALAVSVCAGCRRAE